MVASAVVSICHGNSPIGQLERKDNTNSLAGLFSGESGGISAAGLSGSATVSPFHTIAP